MHRCETSVVLADHPFVAHPGGRYPNSCLKCGRRREVHPK